MENAVSEEKPFAENSHSRWKMLLMGRNARGLSLRYAGGMQHEEKDTRRWLEREKDEDAINLAT